jgi:hypothetical protein
MREKNSDWEVGLAFIFLKLNIYRTSLRASRMTSEPKKSRLKFNVTQKPTMRNED